MNSASEPPESQRDTIPAPPPTELDNEPPHYAMPGGPTPSAICLVCLVCDGMHGDHHPVCPLFFQGV